MIIYYSGVGTPRGTNAEELVGGASFMVSYVLIPIRPDQLERVRRLAAERVPQSGAPLESPQSLCNAKSE